MVESSAPTLLIVDDNPLDRQIFRFWLDENAGDRFRVIEAEDKASAFNLCSTARIDCILLDLEMPGGDGLELLADLNERFGTRRWPVVILTGHGSEERAVEAMKRGAQDYISKEKASAEGLIRAIENSIEAVQSEKFRAERQRELEEEVARLRRTTSPAEAGQEEAN